MSKEWFDVLTPIFAPKKIANLAVSVAADPTNEDKAYCDYFKKNAEADYDQAMQDNNFVRTTCCQFSTHEEHDSCPA